MGTTNNDFYMPYTPITNKFQPYEQCIMVPVKTKVETDPRLENPTNVPTLKGNGPESWAGLMSTLLRLNASNTPLFLIRKLPNYTSVADQYDDGIIEFLWSTSDNRENWTACMPRSSPKNYIPVGDIITMKNSAALGGSLILYAHKDICYTGLPELKWNTVTNSSNLTVTLKYPNMRTATPDIKKMYVSLGWRFHNGYTSSIMVPKICLFYMPALQSNYSYMPTPFGIFRVRCFIQANSSDNKFFVNTPFIYNVQNSDNGSLRLHSTAMQALQHMAFIINNSNSELSDALYQGLMTADNVTMSTETVNKILIASPNDMDPSLDDIPGLCHPQAFGADEEKIVPRISGYMDLCACVGTDDTEGKLNQTLNAYKKTKTDVLRLRCVSKACNDPSSTAYKITAEDEPACSNVDLCIQDPSVKTSITTLISTMLPASVTVLSDQKTCNFPPPPAAPPAPPSRAPTTLTGITPTGSTPTGITPTGSSPTGSTPTGSTLTGTTPTDSTLTDSTVTTPTDTVETPEALNIGAIVGGAVGGLLVLIVIAFCIYWFVIRPRNKPVTTVTPL
jgi:hypothetical protein